MAGVAVDGSSIIEVSQPNYVTYDIYYYEPPGENTSGGWYYGGSGSTNAKISGYVTTSLPKLKIQGSTIAKIGDSTSETWVADPPVPSSSAYITYTNIQPATSGSGQGTITRGSDKGSLSSSAIALIGSEVTTHLGVKTTIAEGNTKMDFTS
ncbi:hypothetical protein M6D81_15380 [Paenibacillus sp. J5C_2022]|uniref:hypothetical protein n=1 Tax=Paenibacillus sp. J5C2022 TaxID=2977129 RepID=UPI0021D1E7DE|nr:hypothetical protein [Paenibacillus sp. J5C2022]MCU6710078.1 hypothetical protein [Paenibacillus sp. J5C2022]